MSDNEPRRDENLAATQHTELEELSPSARDLTGQLVAGDFLVKRRLGQGGMGEVYLAEQQSLGRKVALKILRPDLALKSDALKRFEIEARAVAALTHPNILQIHVFGEWQGLRYFAMELVEGRNLREHLMRKGLPDALSALRILRQVASALQRAAQAGILHRDIKPENILITRKDEVKVADFGLSRQTDQPLNLTQSGVTMGTPLYMSPEQVEGKPVDPRTDIYSLGVTAYHMFAGHPPFQGSSPFEVAVKHVRDEPEPLRQIRPDLPPEICAIVHKMMAKAPEDRYQTARELLSDLSRARGLFSGEGNPTPLQVGTGSGVAGAPSTESAPTAPITSEHESAPRRWIPGALGLLGALLLGAGAGWMVHGMDREQGPISLADKNPSAHDLERTKRAVAEQYLSGGDDARNPMTGAVLCMELGLIYLERDLDEAGAWFTKLIEAAENLTPTSKNARAYQVTGHLGLAIVQALRNQPAESVRLLREVAKGNGPPARGGYLTSLLADLELRKWLDRAYRQNVRNGARFADMPKGLLRGGRFPGGRRIP